MVFEISQYIWRKSTASGSEACVEVASAEQSVLIRDSKNPRGPIIAFSGAEWLTFVTRVRAGDFDTASLRQDSMRI
jgi:hypothetical protein